MSKIYLHSWHSDFADTQRLAEEDELPPAVAADRLRLFRCACSRPAPTRIRRSWWMRLLPFLRLYRCDTCGRRVLRTKARHRSGYEPASMPARLLPSAEIHKLRPGEVASMLEGKDGKWTMRTW